MVVEDSTSVSSYLEVTENGLEEIVESVLVVVVKSELVFDTGISLLLIGF